MTARILLAALLLVATGGVAAQGTPTAEELGVPLYPGAKYDATNSAGMSSESEHYWIFTTADPLPKAVTFYESRTGKKGVPLEGAVLIALIGAAPFPEHAVMIEKNRPGMYPEAVQTIITVRRSTPESPPPEE